MNEVTRAMTSDRDDARVTRLRAIASLLDSRFRIPGTSIRFGYDAILGLLPAAGDTAAFLVAAYILFEAKRMGVGFGTRARMAWNIVLDLVVGSIPLLGNVFDVFHKASRKNLRLMGIEPLDEGGSTVAAGGPTPDRGGGSGARG